MSTNSSLVLHRIAELVLGFVATAVFFLVSGLLLVGVFSLLKRGWWFWWLNAPITAKMLIAMLGSVIAAFAAGFLAASLCCLTLWTVPI